MDDGLQFKARFLKTSEPSSIEGIEKYLASGMICGIGPVYAKRVVATNATHRIDRKLVKTDIAAAGFRFKAR